MNKSTINLFYTAGEIRNAIKQIQQLSWTITQFERRFPFRDDLKAEELEDFIRSYVGYGEELCNVYNWYRKVVNENPLAHNILKTKNDENTNNPN